MAIEDAGPHAAQDEAQAAPPRKDDRAELAERAADAAADLYVSNEHEQRRRRFDLALNRAAESQ